jgi:hypothetical protein
MGNQILGTRILGNRILGNRRGGRSVQDSWGRGQLGKGRPAGPVTCRFSRHLSVFWPPVGFLVACRYSAFHPRQPDGHTGARSLLSLHLDGAAHLGHRLPRHRQPDAGALILPAESLGGLPKRLKQGYFRDTCKMSSYGAQIGNRPSRRRLFFGHASLHVQESATSEKDFLSGGNHEPPSEA